MKHPDDGEPRPLTPAELERWYATVRRASEPAPHRGSVEAMRKAIEDRHGGVLVKVVLD